MPHRSNDSRKRRLCFWLIPACLLALGAAAPADEPLHGRIDRLIAKGHVGQFAPRASDAEFLRRIYLDLAGTIPSAAEARAFLDDLAPDKRIKLIDRLLNSPQHARHMAGVFDVMWMERRGDKHVSSGEWQQFLRASFEQNKPYDQLAREVLGADGVDTAQRGPAKFYLDRDAEPNTLTREVGRMFFGVDLQCAQCHDNPIIDDYLQSDYYGIFAFLNRTYLFQPNPNDKNQKAVLAEKADGDVRFKSAFTGVAGGTRPRLPSGTQIDEPAFSSGDEYVVKPNDKDKNVRPIPKYSRRVQLAKLASDGSNQAFNRNIANRLWAHMMGRGLVHPADLHHADNPPAHPELLALLTNELVAMKFDIKAFLRELALSETYQRSIELPSRLVEHVAAAAGALPGLEADAKRIAEAEAKSDQERERVKGFVDSARKAIVAASDELAKANKAVTEAKKPADDAAAALADAQKQHGGKQAATKAVADQAAKLQEIARTIPNDKLVHSAAPHIEARLKQLTDELAAAAKTVDERTAAAKTAAEKLAAGEQVARTAAAQADDARKRLDESDRQLAAASSQWKADRIALNLADRRIERAKTLVEYGNFHATASESLAALNKAGQELAAGREAAAKPAAEVESAKSALAQAQKEHTELAEKLAQAQKERTAKQDSAKTVAEAAAKAEQARQALPDDAVLVEVASKLKGRSEDYAKALADVQKSVANNTALVEKAATSLAAAQKRVDAAAAELSAVQQKVQALEAQVKQASLKRAQDGDATDKAFEKVTSHWTELFAARSMDPLSPEQMAWSVMQATGLVDRQRVESEAELNKKAPLKPEEQNDAAKLTERARQIEQAAYDKLKGNVAKFVQLFGSGAGQPQGDFFATADQALFFANSGEVQGWLAPGGGNLTERLLKLDDTKTLAEELYLTVLTRRPNASEFSAASQYLAERPKEQRLVAVQGLVWGLLTSAEFRFNH